MKAKPESSLIKILVGSHLYGTATEKSDYDFKVICVPSIDTLLLNTKVTNRKVTPDGHGPQDVMGAGETETEYVPIQVFLNDFFQGQTYALEMSFAIVEGKFDLCEDFGIYEEHVQNYYQNLISNMVKQFLTRNIKAMVGYAVSQSKVYGLKTERYDTIKQLIDMIELEVDEVIISDTRLQDTPNLLEKCCQIPHVKMSTLMNGRGGREEVPALEVCGKKHTVSTYWDTVLRSLYNTFNMYGDRVKEFQGTGADWKALSHAIRITEQALELCNTGKLTFPRPNADYLLSVKRGKVPLEEATEYLQNAFSNIDEAVSRSTLPEKTPELEEKFNKWRIGVLRQMYEYEE